MRLLRLLGAIISMSLRRELAFRANLVFHVLTTAIGIGSGLVALGIVYAQTSTLGGWSPGEAVVLLGNYQIMSGVLATFVEPNVQWFGQRITEGTLDDLLLKPAPSMFLASLGSCAPLALTQVVVGSVVMVAGLRTLGGAPSPLELAAWLTLLTVGLVITWASRVLVASLALWSPGFSLDVAYGALWQFGRYPVSMYRRPIRLVLTYVVPVAFISTFPAQAITRGVDAPIVLLGLLIAGAAATLVQVTWYLGLRRYTSATS